MSLSEEERRQLEELELELAAEDPRLAQELVSGSLKRSFRASAGFGAVACAIGIVLLIVGIGTGIIALGVGGFVLMVAGACLLLGNQAIFGGGRRGR